MSVIGNKRVLISLDAMLFVIEYDRTVNSTSSIVFNSMYSAYSSKWFKQQNKLTTSVI